MGEAGCNTGLGGYQGGSGGGGGSSDSGGSDFEGSSGSDSEGNSRIPGGGSGGLGLFVDLSEMTTDSQVGPDDILFVNNGGSGQSVYDSWAEDAEQYGAQAGVDPELVLAIALKAPKC